MAHSVLNPSSEQWDFEMIQADPMLPGHARDGRRKPVPSLCSPPSWAPTSALRGVEQTLKEASLCSQVERRSTVVTVLGLQTRTIRIGKMLLNSPDVGSWQGPETQLKNSKHHPPSPALSLGAGKRGGRAWLL